MGYNPTSVFWFWLRISSLSDEPRVPLKVSRRFPNRCLDLLNCLLLMQICTITNPVQNEPRDIAEMPPLEHLKSEDFPPVVEKEEAPFKWICYWRQHKEASLCLQICAAGNILCPHHALFLSVQSDWNRWKVFPEFRGLKEAQDKSSKQLSASETREMSKLTRAVSQRQPITGQTLDTRRITAPNIVINLYFWLIMLACCYLLIQSLTLIVGKSDQDVKTAKKRENVFIKILISPVCIC